MKLLEKNGSTLAFSTSKTRGEYSITFSDTIALNCIIIFSHSKFETLSLPLSEIKRNPDVTLTPGSRELQEIVVLPKAVRAKGDTILYSVDALRHASDRNVEDFIAHLPGMSVDSQGNIYYNGEQINRFYIEDMDMFGGRYSLASKNIRAEDVATVSIYERHQPIKALQDITRPENAAVNLTLKKKAMLKPVGYVKGGVGTKQEGVAWKGELFSMFIHPKNQTFITAKGTDFGKSYNLENKMRNLGDATAPTPFDDIFRIFIPSSISGLNSDQYKDLVSQSYSVSTGSKIDENSSISAYVSYIDDKTDWRGIKTSEFLTGENESEIVFYQEADNNNKAGLLETGINYELNKSSVFLAEKLSFTGIFSKGYNTTLNEESEFIRQSTRQHRFQIGNTLSATLRSGIRTFQFSSKIAFSTLPLNRLYSSLSDGKGIFQTAGAKSLKTNHNTSFSWFVGLSSIGLDLDINTEHLWADTFDIIDEYEQRNNTNHQQGNNVQINLGPFWQISNSKILLNLGIPLNLKLLSLSHLNKGVSDSGSFSDFIINWGFKSRLTVKWSPMLSSNFSLNKSSNSGDITDFIDQPIFTDYQTRITLGNGSSFSNNNWSISAALNYRDAMKGWFGNLKFNGRLSNSNRIRVSDVNSTSLNESYMSGKSKSKMAFIIAGISKLISKNTIGLDLNWQFSSQEILRNNLKLNSALNGASVKIYASLSLFRNHLEINPQTTLKYTDNNIKGLTKDNSSAFDWNSGCNLSIFPIRNIEIFISPTFSDNKKTGMDSFSSFFLDARVSWTISKFQFDLNMSNITNRKIFSTTSINSLSIVNTVMYLRGFETLLSVKYNF